MNDSITARLPARDLAGGEPRSTGSLDGSVYLHVDVEAYDFHIITKPIFDRQALCNLLTQAEWWGLEPLTEDECEPDLLPDGGTRIYLTAIVPIEVVEAEAVVELMAEAAEWD